MPGTRTNNQSYHTFNSLNAYIFKGEGAFGMDLTFGALMVRAGDEPDATYGRAKSVGSPDKQTYASRCGRRPDSTTARPSPRSEPPGRWPFKARAIRTSSCRCATC